MVERGSQSLRVEISFYILSEIPIIPYESELYPEYKLSKTKNLEDKFCHQLFFCFCFLEVGLHKDAIKCWGGLKKLKTNDIINEQPMIRIVVLY